MSLVRIARTSNYDVEVYSEKFVDVPPMDEDRAWQICHLLNSLNPSGADYYQPKPLNYVLYKFEP